MAALVLRVTVGIFLCSLVNAIDYAPQVTIDNGKLRGLLVQVNNTNSKVRKYLGISFAKAERFKPPTQPPRWPDSEVKDMITLGKACPQVLGPLGVSKVEDMSEDCLNLNVFAPHENSSSPLPVMVWMHGGAFVLGSNRGYDSSYISVLGKVIVVVINYRLGAFGFLTNGRDGDIKGNYGMLDQIEALKWVKRNIHAFNGDPKNVTIFGESAGGGSVSLLMLSKLAKGLFQRAIPQSGDAAAPWAYGSYETLIAGVKTFVKNIRCSEDLAKLKGCLESKKMMEIVNASMTITTPLFIPVIDGSFLNDDPSVLYENQQIENIDIMAGVTNDEGTVFTNAIPGFGVGINVAYGLTRENFIKVLKTPGPLSMVIPNPKSVLIDATIHQYTDWTNITGIYRNRRMYVNMMGDIGFVAPAIKAVRAYSRKSARAYFYYLEYRYPGPVLGITVPSWIRAYHGADIFFVFGFPLLTETTSVDANFSREVIKMWTNFAKTGNPNLPDSIGISWPEYTLGKQKYLSLKPDLAVNSYLRADYVAYWNEFIPDALRSIPTSQPPCTCMPCSFAIAVKTGSVVLILSIVITWLF